MHRQELAVRESVPGKKRPSTLMSISNLASVLGDQGKYDKAEEIQSVVVVAVRRLLGV